MKAFLIELKEWMAFFLILWLIVPIALLDFIYQCSIDYFSNKTGVL